MKKLCIIISLIMLIVCGGGGDDAVAQAGTVPKVPAETAPILNDVVIYDEDSTWENPPETYDFVINKLNVQINQIDPCPRPTVTAYVNVTDQAGYPVVTLKETDFSVTDDATPAVQPTTVNFVSNTATISVALVMDYSGIITEIQDAVDDMEDAVASFVNQLGTNDECIGSKESGQI